MVSKEDIENLAQLARLELSEEEVISLQKDMSNILEYIGQLSAVPQGDALTQGKDNTYAGDGLFKASPSTEASPLLYNVLRADEGRGESDPMAGKRDTILAAFPKREGEYLVVRKIIQKDE